MTTENEGELTPEQIKNWREVLVVMLGPYALIMPEDRVLKLRNKLQAKVDSLSV